VSGQSPALAVTPFSRPPLDRNCGTPTAAAVTAYASRSAGARLAGRRTSEWLCLRLTANALPAVIRADFGARSADVAAPSVDCRRCRRRGSARSSPGLLPADSLCAFDGGRRGAHPGLDGRHTSEQSVGPGGFSKSSPRGWRQGPGGSAVLLSPRRGDHQETRAEATSLRLLHLACYGGAAGARRLAPPSVTAAHSAVFPACDRSFSRCRCGAKLARREEPRT
jgi:hypothetical protein